MQIDGAEGGLGTSGVTVAVTVGSGGIAVVGGRLGGVAHYFCSVFPLSINAKWGTFLLKSSKESSPLLLRLLSSEKSFAG